MPPLVSCGFPNQELLTLYGPTIQIKIGLDENFNPEQDRVNLPDTLFDALVDTGASVSCIDAQLANTLGLPVVDRRPISGAHGSAEVDFYLGQIHVPALSFTIYGDFAGVHLLAGGQHHVALIGRAFLRNMRMVYQGRSGQVTLERV